MDDLNLFRGAVGDVSETQALDIWRNVSRNYASQASGRVTAIVSNPRADSIFFTQELPTLLSNGNVSGITVRSAAGRSIDIPKNTLLSDAINMIEGL